MDENISLIYTTDQLKKIRETRSDILLTGTISIIVSFMLIGIIFLLYYYGDGSIIYIIPMGVSCCLAVGTFIYGAIKIHNANELHSDAILRYYD